MAVHKLILDDVFNEVSHTLIAIHCSIDDYRLAYLLNKHLGISLSRKNADIDVNVDQSAYSIFEWKDEKQLTTWNLVSNACKTEVFQQNTGKSLFDLQEKITRVSHLIPEHKAVNYFLKIDNEFSTNKEKYILQSILSIPKVATAFSVDINKLKSKENLIF
ncbi:MULTISPECIES: IPExxxVDY family protein [Aestuariibaculum]|uniref:IPExxxVDY family protein n=1 Tax=Aestuariibaculum marinum TaxID=2683592 RepID=A0A8J6PUN9_9FLAO|nr:MULTISPECIES: IPExxxVDY family protein [Aestuariibaculum]MBD0823216.1 IPExxxVDY family protein [Aestuariibaculum marinum]WMI66791.1 IPExxxVDY family protein [Aestuariibaculum sp. YM273]